MEMLSVTNPDTDIVGNIYVGKVKHIVKNINSAFIEYLPDTLGFLSFNDLLPEITLREGDDVLVQVVKEASKNKDAVLTMRLSLQGEYVIVEQGTSGINISRKITGDKRGVLKELINDNTKEFGLIIRTSAGSLEDYSVLTEEICVLSDKLKSVTASSQTRTSKTLVYESEPEYIRFIKGINKSKYDRIITDLPDVYEKLSHLNCQLYTDDYSLCKLYSLETKINEILGRNVWLKSGANIVIDTVEAMTVIDINSAKNLSNKDRESNILSLNTEATKEICRQIRLRNISGIIIIDYINMHNAQNEETLIDVLKQELLKDSVRADFIDFTKLGLAEIVRKKIKPPIYEILKG